jgi:hypothetical protein
VAIAVAVAGCGADSSEEQPAAAGPYIGVGEELRLADCDDWRAGGVEQRLETIRSLTDFSGGPSGTPGGRGAILDQEQAYDLFEASCRRQYASAFNLYKLYTRAAGFIGH